MGELAELGMAVAARAIMLLRLAVQHHGVLIYCYEAPLYCRQFVAINCSALYVYLLCWYQ